LKYIISAVEGAPNSSRPTCTKGRAMLCIQQHTYWEFDALSSFQ
jgi:hypothetical protein